MEYTKSITQEDYTTNVLDEEYPVYKKNSIFEKSTLVIHEDIIYQSRKFIGLVATYIYRDGKITRAIDSFSLNPMAVDIETNDYIYVESSETMHKYTGDNATLDFNSQTFVDGFENLGIQLNGYETDERKPSSTDSLYWKTVSAVNSKRPFDNYNFTQTIAPVEATFDVPSEIEYVFTTKLVSKIALFNLDASEVEIKVKLSESEEREENTITNTYDLTTYSGDQSNMGYLFTEIVMKDKLIIDVPLFGYMQITIKIRKASGYAKVGDITLGKSSTMGVVLDGIPIVTKDFSSYTTSDEGVDTFVDGGYKKEISFTILISTNKKNIVSKELDLLRGQILVFDLSPGTDDEIFQYKGFLKKSQPTISTHSEMSAIDITIESRLEK